MYTFILTGVDICPQKVILCTERAHVRLGLTTQVVVVDTKRKNKSALAIQIVFSTKVVHRYHITSYYLTKFRVIGSPYAIIPYDNSMLLDDNLNDTNHILLI